MEVSGGVRGKIGLGSGVPQPPAVTAIIISSHAEGWLSYTR